jgi:hypothetical protein
MAKKAHKKQTKAHLKGRGVLDDIKRGFEGIIKKNPKQDIADFGDKIKRGFTGGSKKKKHKTRS